jgi:hypothetical protein
MDDYYTTEFSLNDGRTVAIKIAHDGDEIRVQDVRSGTEVGVIKLQDIGGEYFRLVWMYLDQSDGRYLKQGIGRAALLFHKKMFCLPIVAADNDGMQRSDGSHLTGDAPGFVRKMRQEGVIVQSQPQSDEDD